MRFPGKFVPAVPAMVNINVLAANGAAFTAGLTLILSPDGGNQIVTLTVIKSGVPTSTQLLIADATTPIGIKDEIAAACSRNTSLAEWFERSFPSDTTLNLKNSYNDPLGFNIPGKVGSIAAVAGTCVAAGKLSTTVVSEGKNFVPGYLFVPMRGNRWVPAINYPESMQPLPP
jgi:hypothetical protein